MNLVRVWWEWCSESLGHTFAGVTAPLLLVAAFVVVVFFAHSGGNNTPSSLPPRSEVEGICVTATPETAAFVTCGTSTVPPSGLVVSTATPIPATATPLPRSYTVQAGDSLSLICADQVADMAIDACISAIVDLNSLSGSDQIFEGQTLKLPSGSSSPTSSTTTSTTSTSQSVSPTETPVVVAPTPTEVATSEPTPHASLVAVNPTDTPVADTPTTEPDPTAEATQPPTDATATDTTPTPTAEQIASSKGTEYTVQPGDSLLGICIDKEPSMSQNDCINFIVLLNNLDGPDQIAAGQTILIP